MTAARSSRDGAERLRAATDVTTNLVVSAGAGTGKTSLLVERVLNAIGSGAAELPEIAAITFTDKAAGELRHRLASSLDELVARARGPAPQRDDTPAARAFVHLSASGVDAASLERRAAGALARLDRAAVSTIHGFCSELLRTHPLEAGVPPGFVTERGSAARRLAPALWAEFIERELGPEGRRRDLWTRALDSVSISDAAAIANALAAGAVPDDAIATNVSALDLRAALGETATRWADALRTAAGTPGLTKAPSEWMEEAERVLLVFASDGVAAARGVIDLARRVPGAMPDVRTKNVADAHAAALEELGARVAPLLAGLAAFDEAGVADVLAAVVPFARSLREAQLRAGLLDFDALLVRARDLLRDEIPVREALKRRFRMILLDEFQDTDPLQYEIVFFAAEIHGDAARDAYATRLAPGRLFIVGDAKQSIYRFRGADYAAYRRAVAHVLAQGGAELTLSTNYRSTPAVLEPINALFSARGTAWRASDYLPDYQPIEAHRGNGGSDPAVEVWTALPGTGAKAADRRRVEGQALAAKIAAIAGPGKDLSHADVLVLLRGFGDIAPYLRALREAGVPFVVAGGRTFFERTEIVQAMAVLRAVASPEDEVSLLAYLRSPAGGVSDVELAAHATKAHGAWRADATVDTRLCPALAAALARLVALRASVARLPVDAAVARIVKASGMLVLSGLAFEAAQRVANLEKLVLAANTLAGDGRLSLTETLDAIEDGLEFDEEGDSPLADETVDAVRVMTIHKAKGLEAKLVILADTAAGSSNHPSRKWAAAMTPLPDGSFLRLDGPGLRNGASIAASLEDASHNRAEHVRLLYVALTRAQDRLIVFGGGSRSTQWIEALAAWDYDAKAPPADGAVLGGGRVLHRIVAAPTRVAREEAPPPVGAPEAVIRYETAIAAVARSSAPEFRSPSRFEDRSEGVWDGGENALRPELAREVGTIVHARLAGIPAIAEAEEVEREVLDVMTAFETSPLAARLGSLAVVGREVPMLFDDGAARWRGVIDLIYRDADGTLVVADYKTDTAVEGAVERHGPQLGVYVKALKRAMPDSRVRAELWMLRFGDILLFP